MSEGDVFLIPIRVATSGMINICRSYTYVHMIYTNVVWIDTCILRNVSGNNGSNQNPNPVF